MRLHLTDLAIRKLPFTEKGQKRYWDTQTAGFGVQIGTKTKTFVVMYGEQRKLVTIARFPDKSLSDARKEAKRQLTRQPSKNTPQRLSEARTAFLADTEARIRPKTHSPRSPSERMTSRRRWNGGMDTVLSGNGSKPEKKHPREPTLSSPTSYMRNMKSWMTTISVPVTNCDILLAYLTGTHTNHPLLTTGTRAYASRMATKGRGMFTQHPLLTDQIEFKPTDRHVSWMMFLNLHGCVPADIIYHFDGERSRRNVQFELKRLWLGGYVYRPKQQRATDNANYHEFVYDLTEKGIKYLQKKGLWVEAIRPSGNWVHQLFISSVTATMHVMCIRNGYRFIPAHEYLSGRDMSVKVTFKWDETDITLPLVPDGLFAIDYGNESYIVYALEADRNTEVRITQNWRRKSQRRTIKQYAQFIGKKEYKKAYGRDAMMMLLYITVDPQNANTFISLIPKELGKECTYMAASVVPEFDTPFKPPKLLTHLFDEPLQRAKTKKVMKRFRNKKTGEIVLREKEVNDGWTIKKI